MDGRSKAMIYRRLGVVCLVWLLTGCTPAHVVRLIIGRDGADRSGGAGGVIAPLPPPPVSAQVSKVTPPNTTSATACDPTDADGDPFDDDCPTDPNPPKSDP